MHNENILNNIHSYIVYYGHGNEEALSKYDLLILEQKGHTKENILQLRKQGKLIIAYLSIIEIREDDEIFPFIHEEDFLKIKGNIVKNKEYNTYFMDISSKNVQDLLLERAKNILNCGYQGLFFDTIANIEYLDIPFEEKEKLVHEFVALIKQIKKAFPGAILIQNNGIESVCDITSIYLDGICFENPPCQTIKNMIWTLDAFKKLDTLKIRLLILEENVSSRKNGLLYFALKIIIKFKKYLYYKTNQYYI